MEDAASRSLTAATRILQLRNDKSCSKKPGSLDGRAGDAFPHIKEAIRLNPDDPDAQGFLAEVRKAQAQQGD